MKLLKIATPGIALLIAAPAIAAGPPQGQDQAPATQSTGTTAEPQAGSTQADGAQTDQTPPTQQAGGQNDQSGADKPAAAPETPKL